MNESDQIKLGLPQRDCSKNEAGPERMEVLIRNPLVQKVMAKQGWTSYQQIPPEIRQKLEALALQFGQGQAKPQTPDWNRLSSSSDSPKIPKAAAVIFMITIFFLSLVF